MSEDTLKGYLKRFFKRDQFKSEVQEDAVREIIKREKDVFISMPPGSGKSLCFQLPGVLQENKITLVFSSVLALINNQLEYLNKLNIRADSLNSTMTRKERAGVVSEIKAKKTSIKFLYITPKQAATEQCKQLLDHMLKYDKLAYIVVDEAHRVSEVSHEFRSDYLILKDIKLQCPNIPWIAMTATAPPDVVDDILAQLNFKEPVSQFKASGFRDNLFYEVIFKNLIQDPYQHLKCFIEEVKEQSKTPGWPCGIIYCRTRESVEKLATSLTTLGVETVGYHAGLKKEDRMKVKEEWRSGVCPIICKTFKSSMGVDKCLVRFICHWDVPQTLAGYYQESGKAGRDGKQSFCRLYFCRKEVESIKNLIERGILRSTEDKMELAEKKMKDFDKMIGYCDSAQCRHKFIAEFFDDDPPICSTHCDYCKNPEKIIYNLNSFHNLEDDYDVYDIERGSSQAKEMECTQDSSAGFSQSVGGQKAIEEGKVASNDKKLFDYFKNAKPRKENKIVINDSNLKKRLKVEEEKKKESPKRNKFSPKTLRRDPLTQTSIFSYFAKSPSNEQNNDSSLLKNNSKPDVQAKDSLSNSSLHNSVPQTSTANKDTSTDFTNLTEPEEANLINEIEETNNINQKLQDIPSNSQINEISRSDTKDLKRPGEDSPHISDKRIKLDSNSNLISPWTSDEKKLHFCKEVTDYLIPFYNTKQITTKDLFKALAKHIFLQFYGKKIENWRILCFISDLFEKHPTITSVEDFL